MHAGQEKEQSLLEKCQQTPYGSFNDNTKGILFCLFILKFRLNPLAKTEKGWHPRLESRYVFVWWHGGQMNTHQNDLLHVFADYIGFLW